ncbi:MAG: T9SS type A sorting domain-containing protein [Bacteroidales bacterium]|nr:T9SS type A sorting domain-containing protein [Bacteroidales bacterium]
MKKITIIRQIVVLGMWLSIAFSTQAQVTINKAEMTSSTINGIAYLLMENIPLVQNGEVSFTSFDQDLTTMLRPDLFDNISGTTARFIGQSRNWRAFYNTVNRFMYIQTYNSEDDLLWYAGLGGGFPLPPYAATSDWFATEPHGYFSFKQTGTNVYELLIYLNTNMAFQVYRKVAWGTVVAPLTSLTPSLLKVEANNDAVPGPAFIPGVYNLKVNVEAKTVELIPYNTATDSHTNRVFQENPSVCYVNKQIVVKGLDSEELGSSVYIIDMQGKIQQRQTINKIPETTIDHAYLVDGLYIVRIEGKRSVTLKLRKG